MALAAGNLPGVGVGAVSIWLLFQRFLEEYHGFQHAADFELAATLGLQRVCA